MSITNFSENSILVTFPELQVNVNLRQVDDCVLVDGRRIKNDRVCFLYRFKTILDAFNYIEKWVVKLENRKNQILENRKKRAEEKCQFQHNFKEGDILYALWGYDQTNVNFFQVVRVLTAKTVIVNEIAVEYNYAMSKQGFVLDYGRALPQIDQFKGEPKRCRVNIDSTIKFDWMRACRWHGQGVSF